jgi:mono/diheme cytochrome c family protein
MSCRSWGLPVFLLAVGSASLLAAQRRAPHTLPAEVPVALPAAVGSELTAAHCGACHSIDYLVTQPRGMGATFWQSSVAKMRLVYGAEMSDEEATIITRYLARAFGGAEAPSAGRR